MSHLGSNDSYAKVRIPLSTRFDGRTIMKWDLFVPKPNLNSKTCINFDTGRWSHPSCTHSASAVLLNNWGFHGRWPFLFLSPPGLARAIKALSQFRSQIEFRHSLWSAWHSPEIWYPLSRASSSFFSKETSHKGLANFLSIEIRTGVCSTAACICCSIEFYFSKQVDHRIISYSEEKNPSNDAVQMPAQHAQKMGTDPSHLWVWTYEAMFILSIWWG